MKGQQYEGLEDVHPLMRDLIDEALMGVAYGLKAMSCLREDVAFYLEGADRHRQRVSALMLDIGSKATAELEAPLAAPIRIVYRQRSA